MNEPNRDHEACGEIATQAGSLLLQLRQGGQFAGRELGVEGDRRSNELILALLRDRFPDDAVLSEESADDSARLRASRVWIVDPVDGTREYGEGRDDWAVHVALWQDGALAAGAVALPGQGVTLSTSPPPVLPSSRSSSPRILVSRTRPSPLAERIRTALDGELVPLGSAGAKAMAVVQGRAEIYAHSGGQYQWDSAAPAAVAAAAGLHTSRLDGSPLVYNHPDLYMPDLLVCRSEYAEAVVAVVAEAGEE